MVVGWRRLEAEVGDGGSWCGRGKNHARWRYVCEVGSHRVVYAKGRFFTSMCGFNRTFCCHFTSICLGIMTRIT